MNPRLEQVLLGPVRDLVAPDGTSYRSAIAKEPVLGPVFLGPLGLAGDAVGNPKVHGGPEQAVLAFSASALAAWREELDLPLEPGAFGENFLVAGLTDDQVCIGDVFELGQALIQVSHPRQPCATLARRWGVPGLVERIWQTGRSGWYLRVLQEGLVAAGQELKLTRRPHLGWTSARVLAAMRDAATRQEEAFAASALARLSPEWRRKLAWTAQESLAR
jgi:MOSC domain-containing protein YiiM